MDGRHSQEATRRIAMIAGIVGLVALVLLMLLFGYGFWGALILALILAVIVAVILMMRGEDTAGPPDAGAGSGGASGASGSASTSPAAAASGSTGATAAAAPKPAPKAEAKPEPKPAPKPAPKAEAKPEPKPAPKPAPAPKAEAKPAAEGPGTKPKTLDAPRGGKPDDLKLIKGIGPKLEAMLNRMGYYHFDQIAAWTDEEVAWVDQNLEGFKGRVTRDKWVEQAKILASGGETEFSSRGKG